jgi:hypothetical protein
MLDHKTERVIIINTKTLLESLSNQTCLMSLNRSIDVVLDFENPFTINDIATILRRNESLSFVPHEGGILIFNSSFPLGV